MGLPTAGFHGKGDCPTWPRITDLVLLAIARLAAGRQRISRPKRGKLIDGAYFMAHFGNLSARGDNLVLEADSAKLGATMPAFKPETLAAIALALEMATADLAFVEPKLRDAIEARIVAAAEATGESDPVKLCEAALNVA